VCDILDRRVKQSCSDSWGPTAAARFEVVTRHPVGLAAVGVCSPVVYSSMAEMKSSLGSKSAGPLRLRCCPACYVTPGGARHRNQVGSGPVPRGCRPRGRAGTPRLPSGSAVIHARTGDAGPDQVRPCVRTTRLNVPWSRGVSPAVRLGGAACTGWGLEPDGSARSSLGTTGPLQL